MDTKVKDLTDKVEAQKKNIERLTLTVSEAAGVLGVGQNKMRQLTKVQGFPVIKVGTRILIPTSKFETWINDNVGKQF
nr:helix-turn-helix domain-containing protein [uncultured Cellulosilyticum sp.]